MSVSENWVVGSFQVFSVGRGSGESEIMGLHGRGSI